MIYQSGDQIGPYKLLEFIGRGKTGVVWRAAKESAVASQDLAIKIPYLPDESIDAIRSESTAWVRASGHVNIVQFIESAEYDGQLIMVSEFIEDGSLDQWIREKGETIDTPSALQIITDVLHGLKHLHSKNIIHRDIKPANILLQKGVCRITDFGFSRIMSDSWSMVSAGSPGYMAPEVWKGNSLTFQSDIWSAGVMLYRLLEGRLPFDGNNPFVLMNSIVNEPYLPHAITTDKRILHVVEKSLAKEVDNRFKTVGEMLGEILRISGTIDGHAIVMNRSPDDSDTSEELLIRLKAFSFEEISLNSPFIHKLIEETGWEPDFANLAIEEYRKFLYLAVTCPHTVVPNDVVDAVWHLHLTYSY